MLPGNGTSFPGSFYSFQVGSVLFISLDANDVCYQGGGAYNVGFVATTDAEGNPISATDYAVQPVLHGHLHVRTRTGRSLPAGPHPTPRRSGWKRRSAAARADAHVDWIVVQMHQCALSSSTDNGCDAGIRQAWVPLFDQYEVDLVLNGHDHDYERSYPVRGFAPSPYPGRRRGRALRTPAGPATTSTTPAGRRPWPPNSGATVNTFTPRRGSGRGPAACPAPSTRRAGTVYMVLGGGGTNKRDNAYNSGTANVTTFTQIRVGTAFDGIAAGTKPLSDASEPCTWSAKTDTSDAYGIAYFSVDPYAGEGTRP